MEPYTTRLIIDGMCDGAYLGGHRKPPYAIYDPEQNDWLFTGIRWYWLAR